MLLTNRRHRVLYLALAAMEIGWLVPAALLAIDYWVGRVDIPLLQELGLTRTATALGSILTVPPLITFLFFLLIMVFYMLVSDLLNQRQVATPQREVLLILVIVGTSLLTVRLLIYGHLPPTDLSWLGQIGAALFNFTAGRRPEVILHTVGGQVQEPYERITIDIPPDYIGEIQQAMAGRKGRLEQMTTDADGRVRMEFVLPVRGLIGYRGQLLTETRGTALLHQIGEGYGPWAGEVTHRTNGVLIADRAGTSNAYALFNLQDRSELFIGSGVDVYEGMIVGENARSGDMDVNPTKEKKLTNIRTHAHDEALRLTPPRPLTLESAIEFIGADELVEVTPSAIRLRKRLLPKHERERERGRAYDVVRAERA